MDPDIVALLGGDPGNPVASLADAFRKKRALGVLGMATGDPAMASLGKELTGESQHGVTNAVQAQHLGIQQQQLQDMMRHRLVGEDLGQQRVDQGDEKIDAMNKALALRGVRYNPNSGTFENIAGLARPPRRSLLPGATGASAPAPMPTPQPGGAPAQATGPSVAPPEVLGKWQDQALKALGADFNPSSGRAGEFGKNQARVNAAKRLLALGQDEHGAPRDLTPQQMPELAQGLASLISGGGAGAQSQIEHLTPQSMRGDWAKIAQWVTNEPHGTGQQAFVQNMLETAQREAQVAQQGIDQVRGQLGAKHQRILQAAPQASRKVLQGFGWDLGPDGLPVQMQAKPPPAAVPAPASSAAVRRFTRGPDGNLVEVK